MQDNVKNISQILNIIRAGGGVTFDASPGSNRNPERLEEVARAAAKARVTVTISGIGYKQTRELESIARAGRGRVVFVL
jgi:hypothetical protein